MHIIKESNCGISVAPESSIEIRDAIIKVYNANKEQRETWGTNGYEYLQENHTFDIISKKYLDFFQTIQNE